MPPAARVTDMHACPMMTPAVVPIPHVGGPILPPCAPTVLIGGLPAARVSDLCVCVGPPDVIITGAWTVLICGMPAARIGDKTAHGGAIVTGLPTVLIGESGGGSSCMGAGAGEGAGGSVSTLLSSAPGLPALKEQAEALIAAAKEGSPFCDRCAAG